MIYKNPSSCLLIVSFYTSKLQISSPGRNMLLKHVHGLNVLHSSPPGPVFLICGWNCADTAPKPWLCLLSAKAAPPAPTLVSITPCLTHQHRDWEGTQARQVSCTGQWSVPYHRTRLCNKSCSSGSRERRWGLAPQWLLLRDCLGICRILRAGDWFPACRLFLTTTLSSPIQLSILIDNAFPVSKINSWIGKR